MSKVLMWILLACAASRAFAAGPTVDFERDVRPLLTVKCVRCHGPGEAKGGLRLDQADSAFSTLESGNRAIEPGSPDASELLARVENDDEPMPPEGERLSSAQIEILRRWIAAGAVWPAHWAYRPLSLPLLPEAKADGNTGWAKHPIDRFIAAGLAARGLVPSAAADRRVLIRRLYYDLIGLPPSPDEADAFEEDSIRDPEAAYNALVDRLLASPRYGERWARHWLDVVHFAETHGHDQDRPRETAWPYRDYVIASLNEDKPYARFVEEQVAADALFPEHPEVTPALGLLAAGPWDESSLRDIREDTLDRQIARYLDRDDIIATVMSTFTSTTVHCARCHNHKFDPIPQSEYYALQAVFAGTEKAERLYDLDPARHSLRQHRMREKVALDTGDAQFINTMLTDDLRNEIENWEQSLGDGHPAWIPLAIASANTRNGTAFETLADGALLAVGDRPETDTYTLVGETALRGITGVRIELLTHESLPHGGPGRQENGNLHLSELRAFVEANGPTGAAPRPTPLTIVGASADFNQNGWDIAKAVDGNPQTAWGIYPEVGKSHDGVFEFATDVGEGTPLRLIIELDQHHGGMHTIGCLRLSVTTAPRPLRSAVLPGSVRPILDKPIAERTEAEHRTLATHYLSQRVERDLAELPPAQRVYAGANIFPPNAGQKPLGRPRPIQLLHRGEITKPIGEASPGALSCIHSLPSQFDVAVDDEAARRAALARWMTHHDNPLTWRSIVNRVWHYHFGRGLVSTPNDFGRMGAAPSHPELLDWLAATFRDSGGSLKSLHRMITTSKTYRQAAAHNPAAAKIDPDNRYLWRSNRRRLDAESLRDSLLQLSGQLDLAMGGPSVKQFVMSPGIHVTPNVDYAAFELESPANRRRSIYRFLFRTVPDPLMESLDCPAGDQLAPTRTESVTALQALTMLNNPFVVRQCEQIAATVTGESDAERVRRLVRIVLNREPIGDETAEFVAHIEKHGLASLCRALVNSNEFLFVE